MKILYPYLKQYWKLVTLALFLAAVNQVFSLLDPVVFRHLIDESTRRWNKEEDVVDDITCLVVQLRQPN